MQITSYYNSVIERFIYLMYNKQTNLKKNEAIHQIQFVKQLNYISTAIEIYS